MLELILKYPAVFALGNFHLFKRSVFFEESLTNLHLFALNSSTNKGGVFWDTIRNKKLNKVLLSAAQLPFWKGKISDEVIFSSEPVSKLRFLPVITKIDLKNAPIGARTNLPMAKKYGAINYTSGSTGEPLSFFTDERMWVHVWALLSRMANVREAHQRSWVHLWPTPNPNFRFKNHFYVKTIEDLTNIKREIYALLSNPSSILLGFPSLVRLLAECVDQDRITLRPALILTAGEELTPEMRSFFEGKFDCRVINYYGCREISVMAGQCGFSKFHESAEDLIIEIVSENGLSVVDGKIGRVVVTSLNNHIHPFIRYYFGDYGFFHKEPCLCGNPSPSFNFIGRAHETVPIMLPDGSQIMPYGLTGVFNLMFEKISQYQINHHAPYSFIIRIVPTGTYGDKDKARLLSGLRSITKNSHITLQRVNSISRQGIKVIPYIKSF